VNDWRIRSTLTNKQYVEPPAQTFYSSPHMGARDYLKLPRVFCIDRLSFRNSASDTYVVVLRISSPRRKTTASRSTATKA